jgi:hypothetical protein
MSKINNPPPPPTSGPKKARLSQTKSLEEKSFIQDTKPTEEPEGDLFELRAHLGTQLETKLQTNLNESLCRF